MVRTSRALSSNDADLAVALEHRKRHVRGVRHVSMQAQVLEEIVLAEAIA